MEDLGNNIYKIEKVDLLSVANEKKNDDWRLGQICCCFLEADQIYEVSYSFCKELEVNHYRLVVGREEEVPSISRVYRSAQFYENEMKELFGLNIVAMKVDMQNKLYRIDAETPFVPPVKKEEA